MTAGRNDPIRFLTLFARDVERTAQLYRLLGLGFVEEQHGGGPVHLASVTDAFVLEIYPGADVRSPGVLIGFEVADLDVVREGILAAGFEIVKDATAEARRLIVADPEGRKLFVSGAPSSPSDDDPERA